MVVEWLHGDVEGSGCTVLVWPGRHRSQGGRYRTAEYLKALVTRFLSLRGRRLYSLRLLLVLGGCGPPSQGIVLFLPGYSGMAAMSHLVSKLWL